MVILVSSRWRFRPVYKLVGEWKALLVGSMKLLPQKIGVRSTKV